MAALTAAELFDKFLDWTQKHREESTLRVVRHASSKTSSTSSPPPRPSPAADVRPFHLSEWADFHQPKPGEKSPHKKPWGDTARRQALVAIQRPFNWAFKLGYVQVEPAPPRREAEGEAARAGRHARTSSARSSRTTRRATRSASC